MPCPSYIHPRCTDIPRDGSLLVTVKQDGGTVYQEIVSRDVFEDPSYLIQVPRGRLYLAVTCGVERMRLGSSDVLATVRSSQADRLYSFVEPFYVTAEQETLEGTLSKQHTLVYFNVLGDTDGRTLSVSGSWSGMNTFTMEGVRGAFSVDLDETMKDGDEYVFCIARQGDCSLSLTLSSEGKEDRVVPLGEMMLSAGYLIDNPVLADVHVTVDFSAGLLSVRVGDWGETVNYDIVTI